MTKDSFLQLNLLIPDIDFQFQLLPLRVVLAYEEWDYSVVPSFIDGFHDLKNNEKQPTLSFNHFCNFSRFSNALCTELSIFNDS